MHRFFLILVTILAIFSIILTFIMKDEVPLPEVIIALTTLLRVLAWFVTFGL